MSFHLGRPILVMITISVLAGGASLFRERRPITNLTVWVFADAHFTAYRELLPGFQRCSGKPVNIQIVQDRAEQVRLQGIFSSEKPLVDTPDLVEIEISRIGKFFRPPVAEVGFLPLNELIQRDHIDDLIIASRFAPWSKKGIIFGIPNDVHPCTITYRDDLFREAGIDLAAAKTWPEFQQKCVTFKAYWLARGFVYRHAMELNVGSPEDVYKMLLQRHLNLVDDNDRVFLDHPKVAATIAFVAGCVDGPRAFSGSSSGGEGPLTRDLQEGNLCAFITPDWRASTLKQFGGPKLRGRLRMMPMPVFDPDDAPTSTWGGTMIAILKASPNHEAAWELAKYLYMNPQGMTQRHATTGIIPPITTLWERPEFHQADPYFGGQKIDELYIELARQLPARYVTPATNLAMLYLGDVYRKARSYAATRGTDGLEAACQVWLNDAATDLKKRMKQWEF